MRKNQQLRSQTWFSTRLINPRVTHFACSWWVCIHQQCTEACTSISVIQHTEAACSFCLDMSTFTLLWQAEDFPFIYCFLVQHALQCSFISHTHTEETSSADVPVFSPVVPIQQTKIETDAFTVLHLNCLRNVFDVLFIWKESWCISSVCLSIRDLCHQWTWRPECLSRCPRCLYKDQMQSWQFQHWQL